MCLLFKNTNIIIKTDLCLFPYDENHLCKKSPNSNIKCNIKHAA